MGRKPRIYTSSNMYHIILRGNDRQNLFISNSDRLFLLKRLEKYSSELDIHIYAYTLMGNHIHLLVGNAKKLSLFVQKLANSYVYYFNRKYERSGHLFQGRFKSEAINDEDYFKKVFRYILHNPQNAHISSYQNYKWSSYTETISNTKNKIIKQEFLLNVFDSVQALENYLQISNKEKFLEYENKTIMTDNRALKYIQRISKRKNPLSIKSLNYEQQKSILKELKKIGISTNQLSRLLHISRYYIKAA